MLNVKAIKTSIYLLFLNCLQLQSQVIEIGSLFDFYMGEFQKNIRISERIQDQWDLSNYFLQHTHYNANIDSRIDSVESITQVLFVYFKRNDNIPNILELIDDGNHFDNEPDDGIYGNYLCGDFKKFITNEAIIDVSMDTIGINYHISGLPVNYLPEIPKIYFPSHQSVVSSEKPEIYWEIDPNADGCGAILLGSTPNLGEELEDIIWEKEYRSNKGLFKEIIPVRLTNNNDYTLLIWSYTNTKIIDKNWNHGAYSLEWCEFVIDTLQIQKIENLMLSQNFPNPFNNRTIIKYNIPYAGDIYIKIFNIIGQEITTLTDLEQSAGEHYVMWNGKNDYGITVPTGLYLYNLTFNSQSISRKMLLTR